VKLKQFKYLILFDLFATVVLIIGILLQTVQPWTANFLVIVAMVMYAWSPILYFITIRREFEQ